MWTSPNRRLAPTRIRAGAALLAAIVVLAAPSTHARAAEAYDLKPYGTKCVSGQTDERGYTYTICHDAKQENYLRVHDPAGTQISYTRMPGANDVAPAPDGSYVYVSGGGYNTVTRVNAPLRKFLRQGNTYVQDYAYKPPTFTHWGTTYQASGRQIATDGYGNLYVANGVWMVPAPHVVTKYAPDGRLLDKFGDFSNTWAYGVFYNLSGIAVSRDGRYIYTSEVTNGRVQRFDRRADGRYEFGLAFGNTQANDPQRTGRNCVAGSLSAPYDLAVDAWGDVWTTSTSCTRITKWNANGAMLFSSFAGNRGATLPGGPTLTDSQQRSHNLAVNARGDVIVGETGNILVRQGAIPAWPALGDAPVVVPPPNPQPDPQPQPDPNPQPQPDPDPQPDAAAPVVQDVVIPATTRTREIEVRTTATDDRGVTQMRLATDDGNWNAWQAFGATVRFNLRAGVGKRGVYVQVRDAAGRESNVIYRVTTALANDAVQPQPDPQPQPQPDPEPDPEPQPDPVGPDRAAPTLREVVVPPTNAGSVVDVRIDAADDRGVAQVRLASDDGTWGAWQAFQPTIRFTLRAGTGYRGVYVQVRDAAGNESTVLFRRLTVT